ncbi:MAG: hypothetical protein E5W82_27120 [Mesorhizobium sp.]|nr:MAG: hypothetical protein E5W82_27120 [Mesorhizobium sp.]
MFEFLEQIANDTAATKAQIDAALSFLHSEKHIDLLNQAGKRKRPGSRIDLNDFIRLSQQPMF